MRLQRLVALSAIVTTVFGQIDTESCGRIAKLLHPGGKSHLDPELAFQCLRSVPIRIRDALATLEGVQRFSEYQSTLAWLKDPPEEYLNPAIDVMSEINRLAEKVKNGEYEGVYEFESDLSAMCIKAYDGHYSCRPVGSTGIMQFQRSREFGLISASTDGGIPQIYTYDSIGKKNFTAVTKINDVDVIDYLKSIPAEGFQDPDARWNSLFASLPDDDLGTFLSSSFYIGPTTKLEFEDGRTKELPNHAVVNPDVVGVWQKHVHDAQTFYSTFVTVQDSAAGLNDTDSSGSSGAEPTPTTATAASFMTLSPDQAKKPGPKKHHQKKPIHKPQAENVTTIPDYYPKPAVQFPQGRLPLAGFFMDIGKAKNVGILMLGTFDDEINEKTGDLNPAFGATIKKFLRMCKNRQTGKVIIDLRTNGGGITDLGYQTFNQFFPSIVPFGGARIRTHKAARIMAEFVNSQKNISLPNSTIPFAYKAYVDENEKNFKSLDAWYGPVIDHNDNFTNTFRWREGQWFNVTDSDDISSHKDDTTGDSSDDEDDGPFKPENIAILSDGQCSSTCSVFYEFMSQEVKGVKMITVGGRPMNGPMTVPGGVKGARMLPYGLLAYLSQGVIQYSPRKRLRDLLGTLPLSTPIKILGGSVNFENSIRAGNDTTPLQFIYDHSDCRFWYTPQMYKNVTAVWKKTYEVAFVNQSACVPGSTDGSKPNRADGTPSFGEQWFNQNISSTVIAAINSTLVNGTMANGTMVNGTSANSTQT